jgi:hypothetical protein
MHGIGAILFAVGVVAGLTGDLMILIRAYRYSAFWFLACLFLPFVGWLFALLRMPRPALPLSLSAGGALVAFVGYCL